MDVQFPDEPHGPGEPSFENKKWVDEMDLDEEARKQWDEFGKLKGKARHDKISEHFEEQMRKQYGNLGESMAEMTQNMAKEAEQNPSFEDDNDAKYKEQFD